MSHNELNRLEIIRKVVYEGMTQVKASEALALSDRQIRRLIKSYLQLGTNGLVSKKAGRCGAKGEVPPFITCRKLQ